MKITGVKAHSVAIPFTAPILSAMGVSYPARMRTIIELHTDEGLSGLGESGYSPLATFKGTPQAAHFEGPIKDLIVGEDPFDSEWIRRKLRYSNEESAAVEMACWDLMGKQAGKPVYELLGGAVRPLAVRSRYSMGAYPPERAAARATELVELGFTTIKIKVGPNPAEDVQRVRAVRQAVGPQIALTIDANCGWDADTAVRCVNELVDCGLSLVEQPTPDGDYAAMARVRRETQVPVMADDMCFNLVHARELVRNAACDALSIYPGKQGGIGKAKFAEMSQSLPCRHWQTLLTSTDASGSEA